MTKLPPICIRAWVLLHNFRATQFSRATTLSLTMDVNSQRQKWQDNALSLLNLAKEISSVAPAKAIFGSVSVLLIMIRVRFPLVRCPTSGPHTTRTPWQTKLTASSLG